MKAIIRTGAGKKFSTMKVGQIACSAPKDNEIKVRMFNSRINPVDMDLMKGFPSLKYKDPQIGGVDGAGEVIERGQNVKGFEIGDKVFFYRLFTDIGTWAEEVNVPMEYAAKIPKNITPHQAGSIVLPLLTAYEGILALNPVRGKTILVHGAGGGVGYQATQIAKEMGLIVIATASEKDQHDLNMIGIDRIYDYCDGALFEKLAKEAPNYVFDTVGNVTLKKSIQLNPEKIVSTTFPDIDKMHKTGISLPWTLKLILKLASGNLRRAAGKHHVELIGQVTGANGELLQKASDLVSKMENFNVRNLKSLKLSDIEKLGLNSKNVGQIILFHD